MITFDKLRTLFSNGATRYKQIPSFVKLKYIILLGYSYRFLVPNIDLTSMTDSLDNQTIHNTSMALDGYTISKPSTNNFHNISDCAFYARGKLID